MAPTPPQSMNPATAWCMFQRMDGTAIGEMSCCSLSFRQGKRGEQRKKTAMNLVALRRCNGFKMSQELPGTNPSHEQFGGWAFGGLPQHCKTGPPPSRRSLGEAQAVGLEDALRGGAGKSMKAMEQSRQVANPSWKRQGPEVWFLTAQQSYPVIPGKDLVHQGWVHTVFCRRRLQAL